MWRHDVIREWTRCQDFGCFILKIFDYFLIFFRIWNFADIMFFGGDITCPQAYTHRCHSYTIRRSAARRQAGATKIFDANLLCECTEMLVYTVEHILLTHFPWANDKSK